MKEGLSSVGPLEFCLERMESGNKLKRWKKGEQSVEMERGKFRLKLANNYC